MSKKTVKRPERNPVYCPGCGKKLIRHVTQNDNFNEYTGKRGFNLYLICPSGSNCRYQIHRIIKVGVPQKEAEKYIGHKIQPPPTARQIIKRMFGVFLNYASSLDEKRQ